MSSVDLACANATRKAVTLYCNAEKVAPGAMAMYLSKAGVVVTPCTSVASAYQ